MTTTYTLAAIVASSQGIAGRLAEGPGTAELRIRNLAGSTLAAFPLPPGSISVDEATGRITVAPPVNEVNAIATGIPVSVVLVAADGVAVASAPLQIGSAPVPGAAVLTDAVIVEGNPVHLVSVFFG